MLLIAAERCIARRADIVNIVALDNRLAAIRQDRATTDRTSRCTYPDVVDVVSKDPASDSPIALDPARCRCRAAPDDLKVLPGYIAGIYIND